MFLRRIIELLGSGMLAVVLLASIACAAIVGTVIQQGSYVYGSWWFVSLIALLAVNLVSCLAAEWKSWLGRGDSLIRHVGFVVILLGAAVSSLYAERGTIKLEVGKEVDSFMVGEYTRPLGFKLRLSDFSLERHDPEAERLIVRLPDDAKIRSYPVSLGGEFSVEGSDYSIHIERYIPDFAMAFGTGEVISRSREPNNPAIQVSVVGPEGSYQQWVFAKPQGMHAAPSPLELSYQWEPSLPKTFKSRLEIVEGGQVAGERILRVNHPLRYKGFTFYQHSYDPERWQWSGILVVKDPGVWIIYAGFGIVVFGVLFGFFHRPHGNTNARTRIR